MVQLQIVIQFDGTNRLQIALNNLAREDASEFEQAVANELETAIGAALDEMIQDATPFEVVERRSIQQREV